MKKNLFYIHSWLGLVMGFFIIIIGLTGAILVFSEEISYFLHRDQLTFSIGQEKMSWDALAEKARAAWPDYEISAMDTSLWDDPAAPAAFSLNQGETWAMGFLNPYTGEALTVAHNYWRMWLLELHYSFFGGVWGTAAFFIVALGIMILSLTGLWIQRAVWKSLLYWPRFKKGTRLGFSDLHKATGVASLLFYLVLGFTGAWFNWGAFYQVITFSPEVEREPIFYQIPYISMAEAEQAVKEVSPEFVTTWISFPHNNEGLYHFYGYIPGYPIFGPWPWTADVNASLGHVQTHIDIHNATWYQQLESLIAPLHFGNFGGFWIKLIYCLGSLGLVMMCVSGTYIWWKRTFGKQLQVSPEVKITTEKKVDALVNKTSMIAS